MPNIYQLIVLMKNGIKGKVIFDANKIEFEIIREA